MVKLRTKANTSKVGAPPRWADASFGGRRPLLDFPEGGSAGARLGERVGDWVSERATGRASERGIGRSSGAPAKLTGAKSAGDGRVRRVLVSASPQRATPRDAVLRGRALRARVRVFHSRVDAPNNPAGAPRDRHGVFYGNTAFCHSRLKIAVVTASAGGSLVC